MRRALLQIAAAGSLAVGSAACAPAANNAPATPVPTAAAPTPTVLVATPQPASPVPRLTPIDGSASTPDRAAAIAAAQADAAARQGVSPSEIHLEQVEPHDWGDASLGCPEPNQQYLQVVTPGFLIVLTAAGTTLEYHADDRGRVVLCQMR